MTGNTRYDNQRNRTLLGLAVVAISIVLAVALAGFSSAGTSPAATGSPAQAQYGKPKKVVICHHTKSKKKPLVSIAVPVSAVKAHLKHHDTLGRCTAKQIKRAKAKIAKQQRLAKLRAARAKKHH
jgi:hypothetical protein